jgi:exodeoxyribonuclease VII large subunit
VPVVSAVGHETDITLTDLAADVRAATPSQAAELLVPDRAAQREALASCERHMVRAQLSFLSAAHARLSRLTHRVSDPRFIIAARQQELDELSERVARVARQRIARTRRLQHELLQRLAHRHPERVIGRAREKLTTLAGRLAAAQRFELSQRREQFGRRVAQLHALSPLAVLGRGYAIALRDDLPILSSEELAPGDHVEVRVAHGAFRARVTQIEAETPRDPGRADALDADEAAPQPEIRS